ncbi:hypothetical protein O181_094603 [Austropuccinia psidii MF-1]|uniref:Uncharacterized protein n=1 Tax=Austropuccinia psidii MF-1 TaxID=1389203 RepID=A0A9Q3J2C6_9BASI|nr:hypothetical protein [Austropuccinia psidii MF-1]
MTLFQTFKKFRLECLYFVSVLNLWNSLCRALYAPSGVSPAFVPQQQPTLVMLANKHTRKVFSLSTPSHHAAKGVPAQDALARTPLWSTMMKPYPSANGHWDPKQADRNNSGRLALDYPANEGWQWKEDIQAWANCHQWDSNAKNKTHQIPPDKTLPFLVCLASKPHGTQWLEELFREPPIPGPSPSSKPPEDAPTCEPEPEVAPTQSTEEPFGK